MKQLCKDPVIRKKKQYNCTMCGLHRKNKRMKVRGRGAKRILIIDRLNPSYYLQDQLKANNINMDKDCWIIRPLLCSDTKNATSIQLYCCQKEVEKIIKELQPKKIFTFGIDSLKMLIGLLCTGRLRFGKKAPPKKGKSYIPKVPEKWIEQKIPDQYYKCWIYPFENYDYLDRNDKYKKDNSEFIFKRSLRKAIDHEEPFYLHKYDQECIATKTADKAINILKQSMNEKLIAIDYETTGLKPHLIANNHEIDCIGISNGIMAYGMPIFYENKEFMRLLTRILRSNSIKKYFWHMKFEKMWTQWIFKTKMDGYYFDGQLASHIIDNRKAITGLKFQTYIKLGIPGYDEEIEKYLKGKHANDKNNIKKAPLQKRLEYVAMDAHTTYHCNEKLKNKIFSDQDLLRAYDLFHNGSLALADVIENGIRIDEKKLLENDLLLEKMLFRLEKEVYEFEEVKKWDKPGKFNFQSNDQLGHLLYEILKYPVHKKTDSDNNSVDVEALEFFKGKKFIQKILEYKKIYKLKNTGLAGIKHEIADGFLHPFFNLNLARSMRSTSSNINFQNIDKHNEFAKNIIRSLFIPRKGNMLVEIDYSGIEVSIGACIHRDKNMIKYINDKSTDMHRDTAADLFLKNPEEIDGEERFSVKGGFVFSQFYGDYWKNCAENLWLNMPDHTKRHIRKKGYTTLEKYEKLVQEAENIFWNERFLGYAKWKKKTWNNYLKTGYIEYPTGFRIYSNMDRKQACNYPIQGSAFHCLLRSFIYVNKYLQENKCDTKIVGQIHDSIVLDVDKAEWNYLKPIIRKIMLEDVREEWKWIILPLKAEIDYYYNNWSEKPDSEKL
jgi:DNA polymerase I-like protein with 3'-5' exonuclease and polymerase domains